MRITVKELAQMNVISKIVYKNTEVSWWVNPAVKSSKQSIFMKILLINVNLNCIIFSSRLCGKLVPLNILTGVYTLFDSKVQVI